MTLPKTTWRSLVWIHTTQCCTRWAYVWAEAQAMEVGCRTWVVMLGCDVGSVVLREK